jgi:hypothetical protein
MNEPLCRHCAVILAGDGPFFPLRSSDNDPASTTGQVGIQHDKGPSMTGVSPDA